MKIEIKNHLITPDLDDSEGAYLEDESFIIFEAGGYSFIRIFHDEFNIYNIKGYDADLEKFNKSLKDLDLPPIKTLIDCVTLNITLN